MHVITFTFFIHTFIVIEKHATTPSESNLTLTTFFTFLTPKQLTFANRNNLCLTEILTYLSKKRKFLVHLPEFPYDKTINSDDN